MKGKKESKNSFIYYFKKKGEITELPVKQKYKLYLQIKGKIKVKIERITAEEVAGVLPQRVPGGEIFR